MPADILGTNMVMETPEGRRFFEFQARSGLHPDPPGRRDQPGDAEDAVGPARNDAGRHGAAARHDLAARSSCWQPRTRSSRREPILFPRPSWTASSSSSWWATRPGKQLAAIVDRTTRSEQIAPAKVMDGEEILQWQGLVREVILACTCRTISSASSAWQRIRRGEFAPPITNQYIRWGRQSPQPLRRSPWPPRSVRCSTPATTSASKTFAASTCRALAAPHHPQFRSPGRRDRTRPGAARTPGKSPRKSAGSLNADRCLPTAESDCSMATSETLLSPEPPPARDPRTGQPQGVSRPDEGRTPQPPQGTERRIRRFPQLRARRRLAVHRLEYLRPAGTAVPQDVPRRGRPALLCPGRLPRRWASALRQSSATAAARRRSASSGWCAATG